MRRTAVMTLGTAAVLGLLTGSPATTDGHHAGPAEDRDPARARQADGDRRGPRDGSGGGRRSGS